MAGKDAGDAIAAGVGIGIAAGAAIAELAIGMAGMSMKQHRFNGSRRYTIENRHARGKYLNVFGASFDNGANLIVRSA